MDLSGLKDVARNLTPEKILPALGILVLGGIVIHFMMKLYDARIKKNEKLSIVASFLRTALRCVLWLLIIIAAAGTLGINISGFVAVFSVAALAISMAVQDTLSDMVGGLQLLIAHPFSAGDYISIDDFEGNVREVTLIYTQILTPDQKLVSIPNSKAASSIITNYTVRGERRIEAKFELGYGDDIDKVKAVLYSAAASVEGILEKSEIFVRVSDYKESGIEYVVRIWGPSRDYLKMRHTLLEKCGKALMEGGCHMPYPQRDIHIIRSEKSETENEQ